jgi:hypothetical protein
VRRLLALLAIATALPAAGDEGALPPTPTNYVYARSMGLAAYRGVAGDNDAIFYNPAALGAQKRFSVDLAGLLYRSGSDTEAYMWGGSVVDSQSSPITAGFAYNYVQTLGYKSKGGYGGMTSLALAAPIGGSFYLGVTTTYLNVYNSTSSVSAITMSAGAFLELGKFFSAGFAGYNFINTYHPDLLPIGMGGGVAIGPSELFHITGDWARNYGADGVFDDTWAIGGEVFLFDVAAVRGGWLYDVGKKYQWWSAGVGFVVSGFGGDFSYRQGFGGTFYRTLALSLRMAVPGM